MFERNRCARSSSGNGCADVARCALRCLSDARRCRCRSGQSSGVRAHRRPPPASALAPGEAVAMAPTTPVEADCMHQLGLPVRASMFAISANCVLTVGVLRSTKCATSVTAAGSFPVSVIPTDESEFIAGDRNRREFATGEVGDRLRNNVGLIDCDKKLRVRDGLEGALRKR